MIRYRSRVLFFLFFCFSPWIVDAQLGGFKPVKNMQEFQSELSKANNALQNIASDFVQVKNMSLLADQIKSKGKFWFKKEDKVRIEYNSPFYYLMVMSGSQVMVKDEQKSTKLNTKGSKAMQSVNRIIVDCMKGTVMSNPDFKASVFESGSQYLLMLEPVNEAMKKMFRSMDVYLNKKSFDVEKLIMREQGNDFTEMNFFNAKHNIALDDALFKVK